LPVVTPNEGFPHDVRIKVSRIHGGRGRWPDAASVAVQPQPREIAPGSLTTADFAAVGRWIDLNQAVIVDYWDGSIDIDEVLQRLARLLGSEDSLARRSRSIPRQAVEERATLAKGAQVMHKVEMPSWAVERALARRVVRPCQSQADLRSGQPR
jgi:hypothetical protein